jgi:hypothetical protein
VIVTLVERVKVRGDWCSCLASRGEVSVTLVERVMMRGDCYSC